MSFGASKINLSSSENQASAPAYRGVPFTGTAIGVLQSGVGVVRRMWIKGSVFWVKRVGEIYAQISRLYTLAWSEVHVSCAVGHASRTEKAARYWQTAGAELHPAEK